METSAEGKSEVRQKVAALQSRLEGDGSEKNADDFLSRSDLARELFARAPSDFLERKTLDDLVHVTKTAADCLGELNPGSPEVIIRHEVSEQQVTGHQLDLEVAKLGNRIEECVKFLRDNPEIVQKITPPTTVKFPPR